METIAQLLLVIFSTMMALCTFAGLIDDRDPQPGNQHETNPNPNYEI